MMGANKPWGAAERGEAGGFPMETKSEQLDQEKEDNVMEAQRGAEPQGAIKEQMS